MTPPFRLRVRLGEEPELRCPYCGDWWPITSECWRLNDWDKCLACSRERSRLYQQLRLRDPFYKAKNVDKSRRYRAWLRKTCPQYLPAYERERRAQRREYARKRREALKEKAA